MCQLYQKWDLPALPVSERQWYHVGPEGKIDIRRAAIQWSFSTFVGTPFFVNVYHRLDKLMPTKSITNAIKKGFATWFVANLTAPFFFTYATTASNLVLYNKTLSLQEHWSAAKNKVMNEMPRTAVLSLMFWSPNWIPLFYLMPQHLRILYASCINVVWQAIMSSIQHNKAMATAAAEQASSKDQLRSQHKQPQQQHTSSSSSTRQIAAAA